MIFLEHINAAYQTKTGTLPVLSNIDIQVPEGETCALIGPSGCGKSTLLKIAAGILTNVQGSVFFAGNHWIRPSMSLVLCRKITDSCLGGG